MAYAYDNGLLTFEATPGPECFLLLISGFDSCPLFAGDHLLFYSSALVENEEEGGKEEEKEEEKEVVIEAVGSKMELDEKKVGVFCDKANRRAFVRLGSGALGHRLLLKYQDTTSLRR